MNFESLLEEIKTRKLLASEIESVVTELERPDSTEDKYTLILLLGKSLAVKYIKNIDKFLNFSSDPMVARVTLQVLCDFWGKTKEYISQVKQFIDGVEWDIDSDVKQIAITIAGEYLSEYEDQELFNKVYVLMNDVNEDMLERIVAYQSLLRAIGYNWKDIPSAKKIGSVDNLDPKLLSEINKYVEYA